MNNIFTKQEIVSKIWCDNHPNHCPILLRDGDNKSVGACWYYLHKGICPSHGKIYFDKEKYYVKRGYWGHLGKIYISYWKYLFYKIFTDFCVWKEE